MMVMFPTTQSLVILEVWATRRLCRGRSIDICSNKCYVRVTESGFSGHRDQLAWVLALATPYINKCDRAACGVVSQ
jgi:hypothetical protein